MSLYVPIVAVVPLDTLHALQERLADEIERFQTDTSFAGVHLRETATRNGWSAEDVVFGAFLTGCIELTGDTQ